MDKISRQRSNRFCVVERPKDPDAAVGSAQDSLVYMDDHFSTVDSKEFFHHAQNVARTFDPHKTLAKLFVLPLEKTATGTYNLRFHFVMAHQISDGLTSTTWIIDFKRLLNETSKHLQAAVEPLISTLHERLPPPQEDLYPPVSGSRARQRWFWAISLALRHVQKPLPAAFLNPLSFETPRKSKVPDNKVFAKVLDYSWTPPLNAGVVDALLGQKPTRRLHRLCREVGCSIGAGCFVLVAVVMMEIYEARFPEIPLSQRRPFIGSFPINPRPFFNHKSEPDSLMLAFSDGIVLPFLSSDLDLDGRIKLLVRSAQRQLSRYQKRPRKDTKNMLAAYYGSRGAGRVIAMNYLDVLERSNIKLPERLRKAFAYQENLAKQPNPTLATCGISSVGRDHPDRRPGQYDVTQPLPEEGEEGFVADIRSVAMNVRPRDGEFLVGVAGNDNEVSARVSYDACTIDPAWTQAWKEKMESILEEGGPRSRL